MEINPMGINKGIRTPAWLLVVMAIVSVVAFGLSLGLLLVACYILADSWRLI
jgi:hypothetical protein